MVTSVDGPAPEIYRTYEYINYITKQVCYYWQIHNTTVVDRKNVVQKPAGLSTQPTFFSFSGVHLPAEDHRPGGLHSVTYYADRSLLHPGGHKVSSHNPHCFLMNKGSCTSPLQYVPMAWCLNWTCICNWQKKGVVSRLYYGCMSLEQL